MSTIVSAEELSSILDTVREFARTRLEPSALECDRSCRFPRETLVEAGALGLGGMTVSEERGGLALARADTVAIFEELAAGDPALVRVRPDQAIARAFWLALHRDVAPQPRMRAFIDWLDAEVRESRGLLVPD